MIPEQDARQAITLAGQGCNVSEIARRLGHDRKTIRIYLNGHRAPGQPRPHADSYAPFAAYILQRAEDDRHLRGTGLHRPASTHRAPGRIICAQRTQPDARQCRRSYSALARLPVRCVPVWSLCVVMGAFTGGRGSGSAASHAARFAGR